MTDPLRSVVPFGKYKGRPIEEVLLDDPAYLQWLAGQDWFRVKYVELHQVVINRGAQPEETPEHNAMQVRFLDDAFCVRFMQMLPDAETRLTKAQEQLRNERERAIAIAQRGAAKPLKAFRQDDPHAWIADQRKQDQEKHDACEQIASTLPAAPPPQFEIGREFEDRGIDVALRISLSDPALYEANKARAERDDYFHSASRWGSATIEIKPSVGDDYPAVLRQMRANGSNVLFVGQYTGKGATQNQFVKTFNSAGITVIFEDAVSASTPEEEDA